jgi:hypothetical protein
MKIKKFINMYENSDQQSAFKIVELSKKNAIKSVIKIQN